MLPASRREAHRQIVGGASVIAAVFEGLLHMIEPLTAR
jgi:hypothetical protein